MRNCVISGNGFGGYNINNSRSEHDRKTRVSKMHESSIVHNGDDVFGVIFYVLAILMIAVMGALFIAHAIK